MSKKPHLTELQKAAFQWLLRQDNKCLEALVDGTGAVMPTRTQTIIYGNGEAFRPAPEVVVQHISGRPCERLDNRLPEKPTPKTELDAPKKAHHRHMAARPAPNRTGLIRHACVMLQGFLPKH